MKPTLVNLRTPLIRFLGKRSHTASVDHTPQAHPLSPTHKLPSSFSTASPSKSSAPSSQSSLKYTPPAPGEYGARSELPLRFRYRLVEDEEISSINAGGAY